MDQTPLEELVSLPGLFSFKVIVRQHASLDELLELTRQTLARDLGAIDTIMNPSRSGTYHSYTLTLHIEVFSEIETLYSAYRGFHGTVYVL